MFKNIGIYVRQESNHGVDFDVMNDMINSLSKKDVQIFIDESSDYDNRHTNSVKHDDFVKTVDLIIVFGGDGTLLNSARKYLDYEIPVLGINMGKVGFLTDIKVENFENSLSEILNGNYVIEERNLVSAKFSETRLYGLNEVVIHSGSYAQLMRYQLSVNDKIVYEQRSDGLIVATPTGSTAYALSAGGPIIHPSLDVWTILPMLPQSLSSRPFIISSEEKVTINLFDGPNEQARICVDGQNDIDLPFNTEISISKMKKTLKLVHPKDNDFFEACREKLGWSLDITKNSKKS
jgi:NAD+ kinase